MKKNLVIDKYRYFTAKGLKPNEEKEILELADLHIGKNTMNKYGEESINLLYKYLEDKEKIDEKIKLCIRNVRRKGSNYFIKGKS